MNTTESLIAISREYSLSQSSVLATLVKVEGSAYQQLGTKILITESGQIVGAINSFCPCNIYEHAQTVRRVGKPCLVVYDICSRSDPECILDSLLDNILDSSLTWASDLSLPGAAHVLIERIEPEALNPISFMLSCSQQQQRGAIATVFRSSGLAQVGDRLFLDVCSVVSSLKDTQLSAIIAKDTNAALFQGRSVVKRYLSSYGLVEVFIEVAPSEIIES